MEELTRVGSPQEAADREPTEDEAAVQAANKAKKALFRDIYTERSPVNWIGFAVLAVFVLLFCLAIREILDSLEASVLGTTVLVGVYQIVYMRRFHRMTGCHRSFRIPLILFAVACFFLVAGTLAVIGMIRWKWPGGLAFVFLPAAIADVAGIAVYWRAMETFWRGISERIADDWRMHRRKMRRYVMLWILAIMIFFVMGMLSFGKTTERIGKDASPWAGMGLFMFILHFMVWMGVGAAMITVIFFLLANRSEKDLVERTLAELNRDDVNNWKLLNL